MGSYRSAVARAGIAVLLVSIVALRYASVQATANLSGYPNSMAAVGDSITRAYNTGTWPFSDAIRNSWSTGDRTEVLSHFGRILAAEPAIRGRNFNDAVSGAKVADLAAQVQRVNYQGVAYVTILIGANDVCTRTLSTMTSVADFRSRFEDAMATLSAGSPRARIYVASIPNVYRLWSLFEGSRLARVIWGTLDICQSLLADPRSDDPSAVARRQAVQERIVEFNSQLAAVCATYIHCRFDQNAVFDDTFGASDVSRRDFFHPSLEGQARLAQLTWGATYDFTDSTPPVTTPTTAPAPDGTVVTLQAADEASVSGIEYRLDLGPWQRYVGPLQLPAGSNIRFRAVDVNGNTEITQVLMG